MTCGKSPRSSLTWTNYGLLFRDIGRPVSVPAPSQKRKNQQKARTQIITRRAQARVETAASAVRQRRSRAAGTETSKASSERLPRHFSANSAVMLLACRQTAEAHPG